MRVGVHIGRELRKDVETQIAVVVGVPVERIEWIFLVQSLVADHGRPKQNG